MGRRTYNSRGKLDAEFPKFKCHSDTLAKARQLAAREGLTLSEFARILVDCAVYGTEGAARMAEDKVRKVAEPLEWIREALCRSS